MDRAKILLVDDRAENLLALEALLRSPDTEFYRALTGREALELLLKHDFALAILDVQMPEMDGFELAELMRGMEQTRAVPIIFVTAGAHNRVSTFRGYEKGAVDFLYKPLDPHVVKSKVQVFLELARQRELLRERLHETQRALRERDHALLEAREALRTRDEFMSIASHELKTPLTSIYLQLQVMNRTVQRTAVQGLSGGAPVVVDPITFERLRAGLEVCERQGGRLSELLDELLDLTRVRLGKLELAKEPVDLVAVVCEVVERFRHESERGGFSIQVDAPSSVLGQWDRTRIEQIITNLISNAIKYGDGKAVRVQIGREPAGTARLMVQDHGIGIESDMQEKIFERFERAVPSGKVSGLGLGLYITRQIVEAHGGHIRVASRPGEGSTFVVELPLSTVASNVAHA